MSGGPPGPARAPTTVEQLVEQARSAGPTCASCRSPPLMHGAAQWVSLRRAPPGRHRRPAGASPSASTPRTSGAPIERERVNFAHHRGRRLRAAAPRRARRAGRYDLSQRLRHRLGRRHPLAALQAGAPRARAARDGRRRLRRLRDRRAGSHATRRRRHGRRPARSRWRAPSSCSEDLSGRARSPAPTRSGGSRGAGHVPLGYYKDAAKTARTFPVDRRRALRRARRPRAPARPTARSSCSAAARSRINTGGEKVYPGGGRAGAAPPPGGLRRGRRRHARRALRRAGDGGRPAARRARRSTRDELVEFAEPAPRALQAPARPSSSSTRWCGARAASPTTAGRARGRSRRAACRRARSRSGRRARGGALFASGSAGARRRSTARRRAGGTGATQGAPARPPPRRSSSEAEARAAGAWHILGSRSPAREMDVVPRLRPAGPRGDGRSGASTMWRFDKSGS